ncbi:MAG: glycosyl hydrolase family 59, partial [Oscillospiraceae bacterium]|nr:glycosyl hydrolase family 59 [Oscillospiraceae bacterium]
MANQPLLRKTKQILVDGDSVSTAPADAWRGLGFVSANGSSRLLMDYAVQQPEVYEEILRLLFAPNYGAGLSHVKIELGADVNSSSGTEPCTMRSAADKADVTRGAGFRLAADAKRINPAVT